MSDGYGCRCGSGWRVECGCGADWTTQETRDLRARVASLTAERDQARLKLKTMMLAVSALIETAKEVCGG